MYLDSSVLVKLFVREADSEVYAAKLADSVIVSSELAYGELWSALLLKEKTGVITSAHRHGAWARFCAMLEQDSIRLLRLDVTTVRAAVEVMDEVHPHVSLRTLDALHLATFRSIEWQYLMTADKRMRDAARFLEIPMIA
jgi:predicted nucleic acid-binding protein